MKQVVERLPACLVYEAVEATECEDVHEQEVGHEDAQGE